MNALQKLLTDGLVDLDAKITDFLGEEFVTETIEVVTDSSGEKKDTEKLPDLETIKEWKAGLTIRDLLRHQGGFPADPKYSAPYLNGNQDISDQLRDLTEDMIAGARRLLPEGVSDDSDHPAARNLRSKEQLYSWILQETKKTGL